MWHLPSCRVELRNKGPRMTKLLTSHWLLFLHTSIPPRRVLTQLLCTVEKSQKSWIISQADSPEKHFGVKLSFYESGDIEGLERLREYATRSTAIHLHSVLITWLTGDVELYNAAEIFLWQVKWWSTYYLFTCKRIAIYKNPICVKSLIMVGFTILSGRTCQSTQGKWNLTNTVSVSLDPDCLDLSVTFGYCLDVLSFWSAQNASVWALNVFKLLKEVTHWRCCVIMLLVTLPLWPQFEHTFSW